jgi:dienelactone hydrolase
MPADDQPAWMNTIQRPPASVRANAPGPLPLLFDAENRPITTALGWARRRAELKRAWRDFIGTIPNPGRDNSLKVVEEDRTTGVIRQLVTFEPEDGLSVEAYLLRPLGTGHGRPGAVVLHSTVDWTIRQPAGLEGPEALHIGLHLARRGSVVLCPRNFLWQYRRGNKAETAVEWLHQRHPNWTGMAKMLMDASRAVDVLSAQPDVNPRRIGAIGHSLGAKEALYLAAFDERVRATVSSEGGLGLSFSNWDAPWYLGEAIGRPGFSLDHGQVLAMCAPRAFLLIGGQSADGDQSWPYVASVLPVWRIAGAPDAVGLFNHRQGHTFPAVAQTHAYEWLDWFLRA